MCMAACCRACAEASKSPQQCNHYHSTPLPLPLLTMPLLLLALLLLPLLLLLQGVWWCTSQTCPPPLAPLHPPQGWVVWACLLATAPGLAGVHLWLL
jgi:hypothetical protein